MGKILKIILNRTIDTIFWLLILFITWIVLRILLYGSFKIPSDSMAPALTAGDNIIVWKPIIGARMMNSFAALQGEDITIKRLPGFRKIKRNDILVFNFPHTTHRDTIRINMKRYYIKRCIGLPGDTIAIRNGFYLINGQKNTTRNLEAQEKLSQRNDTTIPGNVFHSFPFDTLFNWNIKNFGPLYIPKAGDSIQLSHQNRKLYRQWIEWEQKQSLPIDKCDTLSYYHFTQNYYFMAGDRVEDSQDSRYWGFLPEEFIVGKACTIWKSTDSYGNIRWERSLKNIK